MIAKYKQGLYAAHGLVYSFAGAQVALSYRFGDGKLINKMAYLTKMSIFTN